MERPFGRRPWASGWRPVSPSLSKRRPILFPVRPLVLALLAGLLVPGLAGAASTSPNDLALVYDELGDYGKSLAQYRRALELYRTTGFPRGEGDTLGNKQAMSQDLGNLALCRAEGLDLVRAALARYEAPGLALADGLQVPGVPGLDTAHRLPRQARAG